MSAEHATVSIGIPVYNGENYISQAIETLLAQTYTDFELIITDNCSTDATPDICQSYATLDSRVKYHRNETNIGASRNYNRCFELSNGKYFAWAAHDDEHAPTFLEKTVKLLDENPDAVMAHARTQIIDGYGKVIPVPENTLHVRVYDSVGEKMTVGVDYTDRKLDSHRKSTRFDGIIMHTTWCYDIFGLMRREALARTSLHQSFYGTDKVLLAEMALMGRILHVNEPLFRNRRHPQQSGHIATAKEREAWNNPLTGTHHPMPQWLCMQGYYHAVATTPMSISERTRCMTTLAAYAANPDSWLRLINEKMYKPSYAV